MVNVFGSQKMAIAFFVSMGTGIVFYIYDYFVIIPTSQFSHSTFFYMAGTMLYFPIVYFITDLIIKSSTNRRIKNDSATVLVDNSSKKILIGTGIGLGLLFLVLLVIIITATSSENGTIPPDVEFGHYQMGEIIKYGGLRFLPTTIFTTQGDISYPTNHVLLFVGIQVNNGYYKQSVTYMVNEFTLIDGNGNKFKNIEYSSDDMYDLNDLKEIPPKSSIDRFVVFDIPYDPVMKYEIKFGDVGLVCLQNCINSENGS